MIPTITEAQDSPTSEVGEPDVTPEIDLEFMATQTAVTDRFPNLIPPSQRTPEEP